MKLFENLLKCFPGKTTHAGYVKFIREFNETFNKRYSVSMVYGWIAGSPTFPRYAHPWARKMVTPDVSLKYKIDVYTLAEISKELT